MNTVPSASFHQLASAVQSSVTQPFALQIGAMDGVKFDLLNPHLTKGGWSGLLVEPITDMFEILKTTYKDQPQIKLANCAVSDHNGTLALKRVKPEAVEEGRIPAEALGITTGMAVGGLLNDPHFLKAFPKLHESDVVAVDAPCFTLQTLLNQNQVTQIDLVMIDTEGADWIIAQQLDLNRYQPKLVCLEHSSLSNDDKRACIEHFVTRGFQGYLCQEDVENFLFSNIPTQN